MELAISLDSVTKSFGAHRAVDDLSLAIPRGSVFGLLGRNGAGKTTTIRMVMDIFRPDSGQIEVLGRSSDASIKSRVGYLPEERGLYPKMKIVETLAFQGAIKGLSLSDARVRAERWLDRLELGAYKQKRVEELSKGMQQKAQLAATLIAEPELLILDEPFSGMDPVNQDIFKDLLAELNRSGSTIVFSTHVMESAEKLCHEIALIDRGRVVLNGPLDEIKQQFSDNTVRMDFDGDGSFLGDLPGVEAIETVGSYVEIRLAPEADAQLLLRAAVDRLILHHFEQVSPTLHSIFVQKVGREAADA